MPTTRGRPLAHVAPLLQIGRVHIMDASWADNGPGWTADGLRHAHVSWLPGSPRRRHGHLFVAGCKTNQGKFYSQFDHIALLSAPADVLLARIAARTGNPYGKHPGERALITSPR
jgi:hypothetical protein